MSASVQGVVSLGYVVCRRTAERGRHVGNLPKTLNEIEPGNVDFPERNEALIKMGYALAAS